MHTTANTKPLTPNDGDLALNPTRIAIACQRVRASSRQRRTRARRAARDEKLRPPLAERRAAPLD
jgi:hypothetical protein